MAPAVKRRAVDATAASLPTSSPSAERVQAADLDVMHQAAPKRTHHSMSTRALTCGNNRHHHSND
jgi:hypothetical protein